MSKKLKEEEKKCGCGPDCECTPEDNCGCDCSEEKQDEVLISVKKELEEKKEEAKKNYESLQRVMAEFDNYKKRSNKEREQLYNSLISDIISNFLEVIDNLDKAIDNSQDSDLKDGINLIHKQFIDVLKKYNVEEIKSLNETFDPNLHESVNHIDDPNYGEKEIVEVFRKGYKLGDKVIRYAMVKVAN